MTTLAEALPREMERVYAALPVFEAAYAVDPTPEAEALVVKTKAALAAAISASASGDIIAMIKACNMLMECKRSE